jgi:hypothetical protein
MNRLASPLLILAVALFAIGGATALSAPPQAPPPRPAADPLADWTPRPATGQAEPWEKKRDPEWDDPRFRLMDTGPFLNCTMRYPLGKGDEMVYKATVVKFAEAGDGLEQSVVGGLVFDRCTLRVVAGWTGGFLNHSDRRFGLLNTPTPKGEMLFAVPPAPGWASPAGKWVAQGPFTRPLPENWARYRGLYLHGQDVIFHYTVADRTVYESYLVMPGDGKPAIVRITNVTPGKTRIGQAGLMPGDEPMWFDAGDGGSLRFESHDPSVLPRMPRIIPPSMRTKGGPKRWGEPIVTPLVRGKDNGPFAIDTLTIPYENRFKALFFCTGLDFLPDGRIAVCTCHGDVWLVTVDEKAATCSWQRYATGLYHPLGLKVIEGKVLVLERGQLTRLHDLNDDGEADYYECVNNDWDTGPGEHSYDTCLETDPQGNFYFFKTGDTHLPTGGCLLRVSKDGSKAEIFATGFRHPIGMGMSPTGVLTGADQEGNWMPATRIDEYKRDGFYGDLRGHHRKEPPKTYDGPLCWLPREVDNSAGGQVWVPPNTFGPLAELPLHFSYGRCKAFVLLRQTCANGVTQGGVADLGLKFLAGVCRGRFAPNGDLYVCGLNGWQTAAQADGCLQRVRYTGQPLDVPVKLAVDGNVIRLTFSRPLDPTSVAKAENYKAAWWNYRWTGDYGSKRWKVSNPHTEGQDEFAAKSAKLLPDGRTIEIAFDKLQPVMQMQVGYNLVATDGRPVVGSVCLTIHTTGD